MKTIQATLAIILLTFVGQVMALTPVRAKPISKATNLFCKSVENKNREVMDMMLSQGADINASCYFGYNGSRGKLTPLVFAIGMQGEFGVDYTIILDYLLDNGVDVNVRPEQGETPLITAVDLFSRNNQEESARLVELLIAKGAKISVVDRVSDGQGGKEAQE